MEIINIQKGWNIQKSQLVAELYEEAFGLKFSVAISSKQKRIDILSKCFVPDFSYSVMVNGKIVGLAGFQTKNGSLTGGMNLNGLIDELGLFKGAWAGLVLSLFERQPIKRELLMDGIVVDDDFRGLGLGSSLLDRIVLHARENDFDTVRLDVIDNNPRAKKLYESKGFIATKTEYFPYLKWLIGFSGSTTMILTV